MFIDEAVIEVEAGNGGNGCHSYEKIKFKPKGSPDGGIGGRGGHIIMVGSSNIHTLVDMAYKQHFKAERGAHGKGSNKTGKNAVDITIAVPLGTIIMDNATGQTISDCLEDGVEIIVARGGRGGRGNKALVSRKNRNPERCEAGKPGEKKKLRLVLKVLADVGLVGRPNAGKSTLLSRISHARPKIADYPFTTKEPHLGIVQSSKEYSSFVVADIPGLIEDCHKGKGLGIRFLRHIERTRALAIMVDITSPNPKADAKMLLHELALYSQNLADKPKCFFLTKNDILPPDAKVKVPKGWLSISAVSGNGIPEAIRELSDLVESSRSEQPIC